MPMVVKGAYILVLLIEAMLGAAHSQFSLLYRKGEQDIKVVVRALPI